MLGAGEGAFPQHIICPVLDEIRHPKSSWLSVHPYLKHQASSQSSKTLPGASWFSWISGCWPGILFWYSSGPSLVAHLEYPCRHLLGLLQVRISLVIDSIKAGINGAHTIMVKVSLDTYSSKFLVFLLVTIHHQRWTSGPCRESLGVAILYGQSFIGCL